MKELLDYRTLAEIQDAAPLVSAVSFEAATRVVKAMESYSQQNEAMLDVHGVKYWQTRIQHLRDLSGLPTLEVKKVGRVLKTMGLERWRTFDGYHVAWSQTQLDILKRHFIKE